MEVRQIKAIVWWAKAIGLDTAPVALNVLGFITLVSPKIPIKLLPGIKSLRVKFILNIWNIVNIKWIIIIKYIDLIKLNFFSE